MEKEIIVPWEEDEFLMSFLFLNILKKWHWKFLNITVSPFRTSKLLQQNQIKAALYGKWKQVQGQRV